MYSLHMNLVFSLHLMFSVVVGLQEGGGGSIGWQREFSILGGQG